MKEKLYIYKKQEIMSTLDLKQSVLAYINEADDRLLKLIKALAESYHEGAEEDFTLSDEQYKMIDKRRKAHLKGESKSHTWEQVKQNARNSAK